MLRFPSVLALAAATASANYVKIDPMKNFVQQIYTNNYDNVIGSSLPRTVSAVWYYKSSNRADASFLSTWDSVAEKAKSRFLWRFLCGTTR